MKKTMSLSAALLACLFLARPATAETPFGKKSFERLGALLGYWEASTPPEGKIARVWYKLISGGTALHETLKFEDEPEMVTLYHLDGDDLLATHYCSANNQPRLRVVPSKDARELKFDFRDITNLATPESSHMRSLRLVFQDADHFEQYWTWREKGKDDTLQLKFERKAQPQAQAPPAAEHKHP